jgi:hypothetical protein
VIHTTARSSETICGAKLGIYPQALGLIWQFGRPTVAGGRPRVAIGMAIAGTATSTVKPTITHGLR